MGTWSLHSIRSVIELACQMVDFRFIAKDTGNYMYATKYELKKLYISHYM